MTHSTQCLFPNSRNLTEFRTWVADYLLNPLMHCALFGYLNWIFQTIQLECKYMWFVFFCFIFDACNMQHVPPNRTRSMDESISLIMNSLGKDFPIWDDMYRGVTHQSDLFGYYLTRLRLKHSVTSWHIRLKHLVSDLDTLEWNAFTCIFQY